MNRAKYVCLKKVKYSNKEKAWKFSLYYFTQYGDYGEPYECPECSKFHLTTKRSSFSPSKQFVEGLEEWFGVPLSLD